VAGDRGALLFVLVIGALACHFRLAIVDVSTGPGTPIALAGRFPAIRPPPGADVDNPYREQR
jgi:hypothetical protein